jgi:mannitol/fructose-specific phosphotransferase system IIA component (Ntr-type)
VYKIADGGVNTYQIRKNNVSFSLVQEEKDITFLALESDFKLIQIFIYEELVILMDTVKKLQKAIKPEEIAQQVVSSTQGKNALILKDIINPKYIRIGVKGTTKIEIIEYLIGILEEEGLHFNRKMALEDVLNREESMSTGMQLGIALPHAKTEAVHAMTCVIAISKEGLEFKSLDHEKSYIFILILSPKYGYGPHLQLMAQISNLLNDHDLREKLKKAEEVEDVLKILK